MKKLHINSVKAGDVTAKPVLLENGKVLLRSGVELNGRYIEQLRNRGVDTLYIEDKHTDDLVVRDAIREETRRRAVDLVYKTMTGLIDHPTTKNRLATPDMGHSFRKVFGAILQDLADNPNLIVHLTNLNVMDGYLFHHSVNVAILAGIIGMSKGYNNSQLTELGVGALLFDIGMTLLPRQLWNKKGALTADERKRIQYHTEDGYNLLRKQHDISLLSAHCALQHHERYDGSGYPRQLKNKEIHDYAQIVAISDVYDALTSPRMHRNRYTPNEALEYLFASGNTLFELDLLKLFCRHISIYPVATTVMLSTGHIGVVSKVHPQALHRPSVRVLQEPDGTPLPAPYEIDLNIHTNLTITRTL